MLRALQPSVIRTASANAGALLVTFSRGADSNHDRFSDIEFVLPSAVPLPISSAIAGYHRLMQPSGKICDFKHTPA